jgi:Mg2+ and Co2+ transporter CorA
MVRAAKPKTDWVEEFRRSYREPTEDELKRFREVLDEIDKLRERMNIAPLTTAELVREAREGASH